MPKFLILVLFIACSLPGFAQEETSTTPLSEGGGKVIIQGSPDLAPSEAVAPEPVSTNEDDAVREIEEIRAKQLEKMKLVEATTKPLAAPILSPLEEIQKLGHKQLNPAALADPKVIAIVQKILNEGILSKLPPEEVRKMIQAKLEGSVWDGLFKKFPKLMDIAVDMMRDKSALSGLLDIMVRKEDLKTYFYIWLAIFVFGIFVKNRIIKPKWAMNRRIRWSLSISTVFTSLSIYLFYSFFSVELAPTIAIFAKHI